MKITRTKREDKTLQTRTFQCRADTWDAESRTVDAVIATDDPVMVFDWRSEQMVQEVLRMDLVTLPEGAQVVLLDSHSRWNLDTVLGSIRDLRVEGGNLVGTLHFVEGDPDVDKVVRKVEQGHIRDISVGYRVRKYVAIRRGETMTVEGISYTAEQYRMHIATEWEPYEGSLTAVGADSKSKLRETPEEALSLRSGEQETPESECSDSQTEPAGHGNRKDSVVPKATETPAEDQTRQPEVNEDQIRQQAVAAERSRVAEIRKIGGDDVRSETIQKAIDDGTTAEAFRELALADIRSQRSATEPVGSDAPNVILAGNRHERDCNVASLAAGVAMRLGVRNPEDVMGRINHDPETGETTFERPGFRQMEEARKEMERNLERGYQYRNMHSIDLCREGLRIAQIESPLERRSIATRAFSTPAVSTIYTQATSALLLQNLGNMIDSTNGWVAEREANSFKSQELHKLEGGKLAHRARGKKAEQARFSDLMETYKVKEFARTLLLDRQDLVDDEIGAWQSAMDEFARAILAVRPDLVYAVLLSNPALRDGTALFAAGRNNDLTALQLDQASVQASTTAVGNQRNSSGVNLNLNANYLITSSTNKYVGRQIANSTEVREASAANGTINPMAEDNLQIRSDARLTTGFDDPVTGDAIAPAPTMWFSAVANGAYGITVGSLTGTNGMPTMNTTVKNSEGVYGLALDVAHVQGAGASDYRGLCRSKPS